MSIKIMVYDDTRAKMHLADWEKANNLVNLAVAQGNTFAYEKIMSSDNLQTHLKWYIEFDDEASYAVWKLSI